MYCPDCGDHATQGLNYCKQCGTALSALEKKSEVEPRSRGGGFNWALMLSATLIGFAGLALIFGTGFALAQNPSVDKDIPVALMLFGSLSFMGVFATLVYLFLRLSGGSAGAAREKSEPKPKPRREPAQIEASPASLGSVTEHTTRTFEPLKRESNALD